MGNYIATPEYISFDNLKKLFTQNQEFDKEKILEAINQFKNTLSFLDEKINSMNNKIKIYLEEATKMYKLNNKSSALYQLKLKKMYEKEIKKMESIKFNIESNILHMESVTVMLETVSTIKNTTSQIQIINKNLDISKVENIIEEICEQRDTSNDIENILTDTTIDEYDEEELLKELECFEDKPNKLEILPNKIEFPDVPTSEIVLNSKIEKKAVTT